MKEGMIVGGFAGFGPVRLAACSGAAVLFGMTATAARAQTVSFPDFSDTTGLILTGSATTLATSDGDVIRLASEGNTSGSVFSSAPIAADQFEAEFSFRISDPGGVVDGAGEPGADGLAFVVQTVSSDIGGSGGGLGYEGIAPSVAIEFDTFLNGPPIGDPSTNHLGVNAGGSVSSLATADVADDFDNGQVWNARVSYNGSLLRVVSAPDGLPINTYSLEFAIDVPAEVGQSTAFVGFTGGTAAAFADHDLLSFSYDSTIPAPGAGAGLALCGLVATRRRRHG